MALILELEFTNLQLNKDGEMCAGVPNVCGEDESSICEEEEAVPVLWPHLTLHKLEPWCVTRAQSGWRRQSVCAPIGRELSFCMAGDAGN